MAVCWNVAPAHNSWNEQCNDLICEGWKVGKQRGKGEDRDDVICVVEKREEQSGQAYRDASLFKLLSLCPEFFVFLSRNSCLGGDQFI